MEHEPPSKRPRMSSSTIVDPSKEEPELTASDMTSSGQSGPQSDESVKRDAPYYSSNFKSVLKTVVSDSPERHVISEYGVKIVDQFMSLSGESCSVQEGWLSIFNYTSFPIGCSVHPATHVKQLARIDIAYDMHACISQKIMTNLL